MPYAGLGEGFILHVMNWGRRMKETPSTESFVVSKTALTAQQQ